MLSGQYAALTHVDYHGPAGNTGGAPSAVIVVRKCWGTPSAVIVVRKYWGHTLGCYSGPQLALLDLLRQQKIFKTKET